MLTPLVESDGSHRVGGRRRIHPTQTALRDSGGSVYSSAEPSRAEPSRAEPSRAEPSRAEPSRAEPSRAVVCDQRHTGPHEPATSISEGVPRPDASAGRRSVRLSLSVPVFALLLGALSPFVALPVQAQTTVWEATLHAKPVLTIGVGCGSIDAAACATPANLTDNDFTLNGRTYTVNLILDYSSFGDNNLQLAFDGVSTNPPGNDLKALNFCVGTRSFALSGIDDASKATWPGDVGWSDGDSLSLKIASSCQPPTPDPPAGPSVRLSASPNPVHEGSSVTVTARLSSALTRAVTIPLRLTAGSAERDDFGRLESITIDSGQTSGTGTISTSADADTDDETFTVALRNLPASVTAGSPRSVEITITDLLAAPALPLGGALLLGLLLAWRGAVRVRRRGV